MHKGFFKTLSYQWLLGILIFSSCTKIDTTNLGSGLIPAVDNIHTFDTTLNVIANNFDDIARCDSVSSLDLQALGVINNDPLFGKTRADMFFELKPTSYPLTFPDHDADSIFVDSAVLVLTYDHTFGDTSIMQKVQVYPLMRDLRQDSIYSTCALYPYDSWLLGEKSYVPYQLKDSVHGYQEDAANELRIPITDSLIRKFISDYTLLETDSAFRKYFKGFALISDEMTGGEALNYFNLRGQNTRLAIYLRTSKDGTKDTTVMNFGFTNLSGSANSISRDRNGSEITQHLAQPPQGDSLIYIQTGPGSYSNLKIPGLGNMPNSVVHRAELVIDQVYDPTTSPFTVPDLLFIDLIDSATGKYTPIPCDFTMNELQSDFRSFGGHPKEVTDQGGNLIHRYTFNITRYVQSILTRHEKNYSLRLRAPFYFENYTAYQDRCGNVISKFAFPANPIADGRVKLNGTNSTDGHIRINIVYSTL